MGRNLGAIYEQLRRMGDGYALIGPPNVPFDQVEDWQDVGAIAGKGTVHPAPKYKEFKGGSPGLIGEVQLEEDGISVDFEMYEFNLANLVKKYGYDATSVALTPASTTAVTFTETKRLWGFNWFHLQHTQLTSQTVTATMGSSTPVSAVENVDFQLDRKRGLVRRMPGGAILPGVEVTFSGKYLPPEQGVNTFTRGRSIEVPKYAVKYCVQMTDTKRFTLNIYRGFFSGADAVDFASNDYHKMKWTITAMEDYTRLLDDCLFGFEEEVYYLPTADVGQGTLPQ